MKAKTLRRGMRFWPPFWGAGISVRELDDDFTKITVRLKRKMLNRNMFGTQFGGSIFMMTDPFYAIMISKQLGSGYRVWDQSAEIDFVKNGTTDLYATFEVSPELIAEFRKKAEKGKKVLHWFESDIIDTKGEVIAHIRKQLYIREKQKKSEASKP
ncbi:MAG: DUF4442 domain-containing protein [Microbacteriaceae bacterium]